MASDMLSLLPVELLTLVVDQLSWHDYAACRLVCRRVEAAMFPSFARDSFTTCRVMRTEESMQTLIDISRSRLGSFVERLIVSMEILRPTEDSSPDWRPSDPGADSCLTIGQDAFISTGCDREMLTEALLNLRSIQVIQIGNMNGESHCSDSYELSTMPRDPSVGQRSLGLRKLLLKQEEVAGSAVKVTRPTRSGDVRSDRACFRSTLLALGKANIRPTALEMFKWGCGFDQKTLHVPACIASSVIPVLSQLESLIIDVSPDICVRSPPTPGLPRADPPDISTYGLRNFLQHMPGLKILDIRLNRLDNRRDGFVEWLSLVPSPGAHTFAPKPQSPPASTFSCLHTLGLCSVREVYVKALVSAIRKFAPTLQELRLQEVHLVTSLPGYMLVPWAPGSLWGDFLESLKTEFSDKLRILHLSKLTETNHVNLAPRTSRVEGTVEFVLGQDRYTSCVYFGPKMRQALNYMVQSLKGDKSLKHEFQERDWWLFGRES